MFTIGTTRRMHLASPKIITKTVPHASFQHVLVTAETNPPEPGFLG